MIGHIGHRLRARLVPFQAFLRPDPQVQLQFALNPVNPLMVPAKAFHIPQIQKAQAKAPDAAVACQFHQPFCDLGILVA
jgi:hypothetical protein